MKEFLEMFQMTHRRSLEVDSISLYRWKSVSVKWKSKKIITFNVWMEELKENKLWKSSNRMGLRRERETCLCFERSRFWWSLFFSKNFSGNQPVWSKEKRGKCVSEENTKKRERMELWKRETSKGKTLSWHFSTSFVCPTSVSEENNKMVLFFFPKTLFRQFWICISDRK